MHLSAKFHNPTLNHSKVIMRTNKQTNKQTLLKTSTSLRYATPVGNKTELRSNYRAGHLIAVIGSVFSWELVSMPDVHTMITIRHLIVTPWKQPNAHAHTHMGLTNVRFPVGLASISF